MISTGYLQLALLLFLKAFDDLHEQPPLTEPGYKPVLPGELRWRKWAGDPPVHRAGVPGLVQRHAVEEAAGASVVGHAAHGRRRAARRVRGTGEPDAVRLPPARRRQQGHEVNFTSSDDIHTMALLYESMLREIRDAAGDSGRVLHAASRHPLHGRAGRPAARRGRARSGLRAPAASWSRRYEHLKPPVETGQRASEASRATSAASRRSRCRTCSG